ncbi:MAG: hypothetical protein K0B00_07985 [Rhodobacteraceae bacterium]|nr:hypothetical protein [Paracoccaceae bacterium]
MPIDPTPLIVLALAGLSGAALLIWLWRDQTRRQAALRDMAARRGWQIAITLSRFGAPERTVLRPEGETQGHWELTCRRQHNDGGGVSEVASTEYLRPDPRWREGLLVLGPPLPAETSAMAGPLLAMMQGPMGEALLAKLVGPGLAHQASHLRLLPEVAGATAFASRDPADRADPAQIAAMLATWQSRKSGEAGRPILILGADGMRLRLRHQLKTPAEIEAFIDLGAALAEALDR